ncbi:response regulator [Methylomonas montana]|uniref:response regulator n=1 Tax=Methylomonas montana TaxID=3058963 RepID=UPI002658AB36|nr:response regulator [Methylomonas montana]WKJ91911.1 response regulator [Methylomonas montana]
MAKSILIVEDNRQDEMLILRALKRTDLDCTLDVVRDGQQALDYLLCEGEFGGRAQTLPSVVFLDLSLPRVGGLEVLARLRANPLTHLLPVCVLTSSDEERDRQKAYANGANSYVCKPLDFHAFAEMIARMGQHWLAAQAATMDLDEENGL